MSLEGTLSPTLDRRSPTPAAIDALLLALHDYGRRHPQEAATVARFLAFAGSGADVLDRRRGDGHFTASCWLLSRDGQRVLLTHHRKLGRWLQLGGHIEGDRDLASAALREAAEESGLDGLVVEPCIFDLDDHRIPARGAEPEHIHWDVRYLLRCTGSEDFTLSAESNALAWVDILALAAAADTEDSIRRMACKWLAAGVP